MEPVSGELAFKAMFKIFSHIHPYFTKWLLDYYVSLKAQETLY
jgi:hypothetical protein